MSLLFMHFLQFSGFETDPDENVYNCASSDKYEKLRNYLMLLFFFHLGQKGGPGYPGQKGLPGLDGTQGLPGNRGARGPSGMDGPVGQ